jgi:hypothetical protein
MPPFGDGRAACHQFADKVGVARREFLPAIADNDRGLGHPLYRGPAHAQPFPLVQMRQTEHLR